MSPSTHTNRPPTPRQLRYLRFLGEKTGTSFTYPSSFAQARSELDRLEHLKRERGTYREPREVDESELTYATGVHSSEVSGFGSSTSWRRDSSPTMPPAPPEPRVGERTELARYEVSSGERVLYGQRINGCVRITDRPASGSGRSYLVERELEQDGYSALKALVADYTEQARALDQVPMISSVVRHQLQQMASA